MKKIIEKSVKPVWKSEDKDEIQKKSNDQMNKLFFESVKGFDSSILSSEYEETLTRLSTLYSQRSLTNILMNASLEKLLPLLLKDKKSQKLFTCFLRSQFNEAVQLYLSSGNNESVKSLKTIIDKIFDVCAQKEEFTSFVREFFYLEIIESGKKTIQGFQETAPG